MWERLVQAKCDAGYYTKITEFENVHEFVEKSLENKSYNADHCWAEASQEEILHKCIHGDESFVPGSLKLLADVDEQIPPTPAYDTVRSEAVGRVRMGEWMMGSPTPLRRRVRRENGKGEVKILISFACSATLSSKQLLGRGNAIMALIMKIQQYRPVKVMLYDETRLKGTGGNYYFLIDVDSRPLSLAHLGFAISHPGFFRHVGLSAEDQCGAQSNLWTMGYARGADPYYIAKRNERLDVQPEDLIMSAATDWSPLLLDPIAWIKAELQRIGIEV